MQVQMKLYILEDAPKYKKATRKPQPKLLEADIPLVIQNIDNAKRAAWAECLRRGLQVRSAAFDGPRSLVVVVVKRENHPASKPVRESDLARQA